MVCRHCGHPESEHKPYGDKGGFSCLHQRQPENTTCQCTTVFKAPHPFPPQFYDPTRPQPYYPATTIVR